MSSSASAIAASVLAILSVPSAVSAAISFTPGHYYASNEGSAVITQYDPAGRIVGSLNVGAELRGLAFGDDGLLYATTRGSGAASGYTVRALDATGAVHKSFVGPAYLGGQISYGKLALDDQYLYVATGGTLARFRRDDPAAGPTNVYSENQVFDVEPLPNGNLLVASAYEVREITRDGTRVRELNGPFTDVRGVEFDPVGNSVFVTHLGHTGFFFRIMKFDNATGAMVDDAAFTYGDDLFVTGEGRLLVGSRTQSPHLFTTGDLTDTLAFEGGERIFVTQFVVPEPGSLLALASAAGVLLIRRGRRLRLAANVA